MIDQIAPDCEHRVREDGIHEFVFRKSTRAAIDSHLNKVLELHRATPVDEKVRYIMEFETSNTPPIRYGFGQITTLKEEGVFSHIKCACILSDSLLSSSLNLVLRGVMTNNTFRTFKSSERELAIAWLNDKS